MKSRGLEPSIFCRSVSSRDSDSRYGCGISLRGPNRWLVVHRKIDRVGDETLSMSFGMQISGDLLAPLDDRDVRTERDLDEPTASVRFDPHFPGRFIDVLRDHHVGDGAKMEVPQHVAGRQSGDQQLVRIVAGRIRERSHARRPREVGLTRQSDYMVAGVRTIPTGAAPQISRPADHRAILVFAHAEQPSQRRRIGMAGSGPPAEVRGSIRPRASKALARTGLSPSTTGS